MYIVLLAWRYLRTRFIALASIVSVTLGVATLIIVNAVMAGFVDQMHERLHGILSDVEIAPPGLGEIYQAEDRMADVKRIVGDDLEAVTAVVRVPALMHFEYHGRPMTHQVLLIGIDDESYSQVTDFHPYLMNEIHRKGLDFQLRESGYASELGDDAGWKRRREMAAIQKQIQAQFQPQASAQPQPAVAQQEEETNELFIPDLPEFAPTIPDEGIDQRGDSIAQADPTSPPPAHDSNQPFRNEEDEIFDPAIHQFSGIVIGRGIAHRQITDPETDEKTDLYLLRPGDDIRITLPTAGTQPSAIIENCTIVDFYSSQMHEYDSTFAFMSLSKLQKIRQMIDPYTGSGSVSAIQIKLKEGSDLNAVRDKLVAEFPPHIFPYMVQTWQDTQRPLLNAVNMELTILNILLFLIIGVAGFGILATFFMIVVEKTKDIGILKSLGAPGRGVMAIFLSYGLSLGTVGTGVGIILGLIFVWNINAIANFVQRITGQEIFDPMIYYFSEIPTIVSPWMVAWVAAGAIGIAVLASVLPALRAAKLHPVEALRYE